MCVAVAGLVVVQIGGGGFKRLVCLLTLYINCIVTFLSSCSGLCAFFPLIDWAE